jgi:putative colanic acid biosynthesis glycosyltransferase
MTINKISVITVCYNAVSGIERTIKSVLNQTYEHIEYIIIDGGSTDGTIEVINQYKDEIAYFISEKDNGIYDAMNKGIKVAHGTWLSFMNAGDCFADNLVVERIFKEDISSNVKVIYGDFIAESNLASNVVKAKNTCVFYKDMPFCHQAAFLRNENYVYDIKYHIAADYKLFRSIYSKYGKRSFKKMKMTIAVFDLNGISNSNESLLRNEYHELYHEFGGFYYVIDSIKRILSKF